MTKETLEHRRERLKKALEGYDEEVDQRRYRGFLPQSVRNYMVRYLWESPVKYDRRMHHEMRRRLEAADKDYALTLRYLGRLESNRLKGRLAEIKPRMERSTVERRMQDAAEAFRPVLRLVEEDLNDVLVRYYHYVPWRVVISFSPYRPEPNLDMLKDRLRKKWKRMP